LELSLKELKAQNAEADESKDENLEDEQLKDEYIEVDPETEKPIETEEVEEDEDEEEAEDSETVEAWELSEDSEDSQDGKKPGFIPNAGAKALRLKNKALKQDLRDNQGELEKLRAEIDALKMAKPAPVDDRPPTMEQYDYDEAKYQQATLDYFNRQIDAKLATQNQVTQQTQQQQAEIQARESAVDGMYDRASNLINEGKITVEKWKSADELIRDTLDVIVPGKGYEMADKIIASLSNIGDGSEKTWYYLGNNPTALNQLATSLKSDPTGLTLMGMLGRIQEKATKPVPKKRSEAPAPAKDLKGDNTIRKGSDYHKAYKKSEDVAERISIKRKAKKAGVDTSKW